MLLVEVVHGEEAVELMSNVHARDNRKLSKTAIIVAALFGSVFAAWWCDHSYQAYTYSELMKNAEVARLTAELEVALEEVHAAEDRAQYEAGCEKACAAIGQLTKRGPASRSAVFAYAAAMRTPNRFHSDCSVAAEASVALAAVGPDAVPVIITLLRGDDDRVREAAMDSLVVMTSQKRVNVEVAPLAPDRAKEVLQQVGEGLKASAVDRVAKQIEHLLEKYP